MHIRRRESHEGARCRVAADPSFVFYRNDVVLDARSDDSCFGASSLSNIQERDLNWNIEAGVAGRRRRGAGIVEADCRRPNDEEIIGVGFRHSHVDVGCRGGRLGIDEGSFEQIDGDGRVVVVGGAA